MRPLKRCYRIKARAFSLAEILITLAIMGVLTAFTVPMFVQNASNTNSTTNVVGRQAQMLRDTAFMVVNAYERYKSINGIVTTSVTPGALTPYMNYIKVSTTGFIDAFAASNGTVGNGSFACAASTPCYYLPNGATLMLWNDAPFPNTTPLSAIVFSFDPDGVFSGLGASAGSSKSLDIFLYYDGTVRTRDTLKSNTCVNVAGIMNGACPMGVTGIYDPTWFKQTGF